MRVLITAPITESGLNELRDAGMAVDYHSWLETGKLHLGGSLLHTITSGNYDIVIVEGDEIKEEIIEHTELKLIGSVRGSPNNISLQAATARKIPVIAVPGRNTIAVAEHTIALMLAQARNIVAAERLLKSDFFVDDFKDFGNMYKNLMGFELSGRTVGLIGLGQIGYEVAKRLHPFGVELLVLDPYADSTKIEDVGGRSVTLDELLKNSDIISIHCPSTDETRGMLGAKEFEKMKKTAILINTARASVIDENALLDALKSGTIAGAGLDVFSMEPVDSDNEFLELDNVTVMPHMGGNTIDTLERQSRNIVDNILQFM
ncbi:MAG: hydroxyacid dehydrogenase, partial [Candidatus Thorarchaeota archaeon]|nr:hydroxyacid dehydrogenase [Candidatus Thorarchaeota archaeon]